MKPDGPVRQPYSYSVPRLFKKFQHRITDQEPELEFLKSLWGLGTQEEEGYRTGPAGYIGLRNSFLGIHSGAPYTFKNTGSGGQLFYPSSESIVQSTTIYHIHYTVNLIKKQQY
jgi:hypothetical protein